LLIYIKVEVNMIGKNGSDTRIATVSDVLEILEERKKEGGEMGYEQELAYEYAKKFAKLSAKEAEKMKKELLEQGISEKTAAKVIETMPSDIIQLRQVLIIEKKSVEEETVGKLMEVAKKYGGK
jgi:DNA-directed RNA polymerase subunit F